MPATNANSHIDGQALARDTVVAFERGKRRPGLKAAAYSPPALPQAPSMWLRALCLASDAVLLVLAAPFFAVWLAARLVRRNSGH